MCAAAYTLRGLLGACEFHVCRQDKSTVVRRSVRLQLVSHAILLLPLLGPKAMS